MLRLALASLLVVPLVSGSMAPTRAVTSTWRLKGIKRAKLDGMPLVTFGITDGMPQTKGRPTVPIPSVSRGDRAGLEIPRLSPRGTKSSTRR
ncbi:hypothetical protein EON81_23035 [bacterium]|nr:MAG: hypothetical protein EON81_23035 [bacterium]